MQSPIYALPQWLSLVRKFRVSRTTYVVLGDLMLSLREYVLAPSTLEPVFTAK